MVLSSRQCTSMRPYRLRATQPPKTTTEGLDVECASASRDRSACSHTWLRRVPFQADRSRAAREHAATRLRAAPGPPKRLNSKKRAALNRLPRVWVRGSRCRYGNRSAFAADAGGARQRGTYALAEPRKVLRHRDAGREQAECKRGYTDETAYMH